MKIIKTENLELTYKFNKNNLMTKLTQDAKKVEEIMGIKNEYKKDIFKLT